MERISGNFSQLLAQWNSEKSAAGKQSWRRSLTSPEMAQMVRLSDWIRGSYPSQEVTEDVSRCWTADWSEIVQHYGMEMLVEALTRHRKVSKWLPLAVDLEEQVAAIREERNEESKARESQSALRESDLWKAQYYEELRADKQLFWSCLHCEGTGYHMTHRNGTRYIISPRKGSCPHCSGAGLIREGEYERQLDAVAAKANADALKQGDAYEGDERAS